MTMDENERPEAQVIADLALQSGTPRTLYTEGDDHSVAMVVRPHTATLEILDNEKYLSAPAAKRGTTEHTTLPSFVQYVNEHRHDATTLWANPKGQLVTAVFDDHSATGPGWGEHRATYMMRRTDAWTAWSGQSGKAMDQMAFAEFLEEHIDDVVDPAGADLLEIVQNIELTQSATFKSKTRASNGDVTLAYAQETGSAQGALVLPGTLLLGIVPFEGMALPDLPKAGDDPSARYGVQGRLMYRLSAGQLRLFYVIDRIADLERTAFLDLIEQLAEATTITPYSGTPQPARS